MHAHAAVRLVEPVDDPFVHGGPQGADFGIARLPLAEHFLRLPAEFGFEEEIVGGLVGELGMRGLQLFDLVGQHLVELDVVIADVVVALDPGLFRRDAVSGQLVGEHGFADVDAAVVDEVDRHHVVSGARHHAGERHADAVVADVAEVLRLVRVRRRELDEDSAAGSFRERHVGEERLHVRNGIAEQRGGFEHDVHERLDLFGGHHVRVLHQEFGGLGGQRVRRALQRLGEAEAVHGQVAVHAGGTRFPRDIERGIKRTRGAEGFRQTGKALDFHEADKRLI